MEFNQSLNTDRENIRIQIKNELDQIHKNQIQTLKTQYEKVLQEVIFLFFFGIQIIFCFFPLE
jgi:hypothetical protein